MSFIIVTNSLEKIKETWEKYREDYYSHTRTDLLPFVTGKPRRILDIGCARGLTGKRFKNALGAEFVAGIELNPETAEEAKSRLDEVRCLDLNRENLPQDLKPFDLVIMGDILEHLQDSENILKQVHKLLTEGGQLIVSLPNVRNWRVLWMLIFRSDWKYQEKGLMDKSHLRFFTKKSALRLFQETGFEVVKYRYRLRILDRIFHIITLILLRDFWVTQHYFFLIKKPED